MTFTFRNNFIDTNFSFLARNEVKSVFRPLKWRVDLLTSSTYPQENTVRKRWPPTSQACFHSNLLVVKNPYKSRIQTTSEESNEKSMVNLFKSSIILPNRKTNTVIASLIRFLLTSGIAYCSRNLSNNWLPCWVQHDISASKDTNENKGHKVSSKLCYSRKQKQ